MKASVMIVGASAALVAAQAGLPDGFPACGTTCITNMLGQAAAFNCSATDATCLCQNVNFIYGVRDCANEACPTTADAQTVKDYGVNYCASVGIAVAGIGGSASVTVSATATVTATHSAGVTESGATGSTAGGSSTHGTAITTAPVLTTITGTDGSVVTSTIGSTTISGAVGTITTAVTSIPVTTAPVLTTITGTDGSVVTSTIGSTTIFTTGAASGSHTSNGSTATVPVTFTSGGSTFTTSAASVVGSSTAKVSTTSSSAFAPQHTMGPVGIVAAAGMAAAALLI